MYAARVKRTIDCSDGRYLQIEVLLRTKDKPMQNLFEITHRVLERVVETSPSNELAEIAEDIRNGLNIEIEEDGDGHTKFYIDWVKVIEESPCTTHASSNEVCSLLPQVSPGNLDLITEPE